MKSENCIFCKIIKNEIKAEKTAESNNFLAFLDANPRAKGHTLIIPKKHFVTLLDIPNKLGEELLIFTKQVCFQILVKKQGDGFNILMNNLDAAGQVVMHAHLHVLPRWEGDGIRVIG